MGALAVDYDEFGNKKNKKERSNRLLDPTVTQDCSKLNSSRRVKNKKEKRPTWEKIVGGWEIENETDWNWMVSFGRKDPSHNFESFGIY